MNSSIKTRLSKIEAAANMRKARPGARACICPFGEQQIYFTFENMTEAEAAAKYPKNTKYCRKCGGLNAVMHLPNDLCNK